MADGSVKTLSLRAGEPLDQADNKELEEPSVSPTQAITVTAQIS